MASLKFYDVKAKRSFTTSSYGTVKKSGRTFAVAKTPSGGSAYRILGKK